MHKSRSSQQQSRENQRGQVGIIVLLIAAVTLVVALTIANRSSQESQSSIQQEDSSRIFNIAEAGLENALNSIYDYETNGSALPNQVSNNDPILGNSLVSIELNPDFTGYLDAGQSIQINLTANTTGTIGFDWAKNSCAAGAANLLISVYSENSGTYQSNFYLVGNCNSAADQNLLAATTSSVEGMAFHFDLGLNNASFLRVTPLRGGTDMQISSSNNLISASQYQITSSAQNETGSTAKAIELSRSIPAAPNFMDYALASGGDLVK